MKRILVILILFSFILSGCVPVPPIPIERVVMLELFVAPACGRCPAAKEAAEQLQAEYGGEFIILQAYVWDYPLSGWSNQEIAARYSNYSNNVSIPFLIFEFFAWCLINLFIATYP